MSDCGRMRWSNARGTARVLGVFVGALVVAAVVAGLGPEDTVVCGRGHALNRLAQAIMQPLGAGHIDGPSATLCVVPSTGAWLASAGVFLLLLGAALDVTRRRWRSSHRAPA
jgi:hypothetical protein